METYESGNENDLLLQTAILAGFLTDAGTASKTDSAAVSGDNDSFAVSTVNTSDVSEELFQGYSSTLLHFASACCVLFVLVGIPGNLITIIALFRCKKVRQSHITSSNLAAWSTVLKMLAAPPHGWSRHRPARI
jgi:hypothetical protein